MYKEVPAGDYGIGNRYFVLVFTFHAGQGNAVYDEHGEVIKDHPCVDLLDDKVAPDAVKAVEGDIIFQETECGLDPPAHPVELFYSIRTELFCREIGQQVLRAIGKIDLHEPDRDRENGVHVVFRDQIEAAVLADTDELVRMFQEGLFTAAGQRKVQVCVKLLSIRQPEAFQEGAADTVRTDAQKEGLA